MKKEFVINTLRGEITQKDNKTIPLFITTNMGKKIVKKKPRGILLKLTEFPLTPLEE